MNNQNVYYGESVTKVKGKKKNRMKFSQKRLIVF